MGYKSESKSFFVSLTLPGKFLGETEAHSVAFEYQNGRWSFKGLNVNDGFADNILDVKYCL